MCIIICLCKNIVEEMYVYPAMTDAGLALGATLKKAVELGEWKTQRFNDVFLGTKYTQQEIDSIIGCLATSTFATIWL